MVALPETTKSLISYSTEITNDEILNHPLIMKMSKESLNHTDNLTKRQIAFIIGLDQIRRKEGINTIKDLLENLHDVKLVYHMSNVLYKLQINITQE